MTRQTSSCSLSLYHRCLCVLLAYIFLLGPESFQTLAQADVAYSSLGRSTWGADGDSISYTYDANGSLETKTKAHDSTTTEVVNYEYDLQGRLSQIETIPYVSGSPDTSNITLYRYVYNPQGIRTQKRKCNPADPDQVLETTTYLVDPYNPTGYAQVLEETRYDSTPAPLTRIQYTLGEDVISQTESTYSGGLFTANDTVYTSDEAVDTMYLLCDGQGSVRQMWRFYRIDVQTTGFMHQGGYSYDAYGVLLQEDSAALQANPGVTPAQNTNLLYAGEYFDADAQHYYNRARWYNPYCGRFNRMDSYAGSMQDPQSLHKYLYCHNNPINGIDPEGLSPTLSTTLLTVSAISALCGGITGFIAGGVKEALNRAVVGAIFGPIFALGVVGLGMLLALIPGISAVAGLAIAFGVAMSASMAWNIYDYATAQSGREKAAAVVSMVFTAGFTIFGAYKIGKMPSLPSNASGKGAVIPNSKSSMGEFFSEVLAAFRGERVVARQVTIKTKSGIRVRVDLVVRTLSGKLKFIDSKWGPKANYTPNQRVGYVEIGKTGGIIRGSNGAGAGLPSGTIIEPTAVQVDTWNGANPK